MCEDTFCVKEHLLCESEQRISVRDSPERQHCPSIVFNCSNNKASLLLSVLCVPPQIQTDRQTRAYMSRTGMHAACYLTSIEKHTFFKLTQMLI